MTTILQAAYQEADKLSDEELASVLIMAIRLLAAKGAATGRQMETLRTLENHFVQAHGMIGSQRTKMDTAIQMFKFENKQEIRVIEGENGEPWFVAKDICDALTIGTEQIRRLDDDEKGLRQTQTPGGMQSMSIVNESGLYALIIRSDKPEARRFRKWITSDVLPALRKHGVYSIKPMTTGEILVAQAQAMLEYERRLTVVEDFVRAQQAERRLPARAGVDSTEYYSIAAYAHIRGVRISLVTANEYGRRASRWSKENGYPVGQAPDPRWGRVNTYHIEALEYVFDVDG